MALASKNFKTIFLINDLLNNELRNHPNNQWGYNF